MITNLDRVLAHLDDKDAEGPALELLRAEMAALMASRKRAGIYPLGGLPGAPEWLQGLRLNGKTGAVDVWDRSSKVRSAAMKLPKWLEIRALEWLAATELA